MTPATPSGCALLVLSAIFNDEAINGCFILRMVRVNGGVVNGMECVGVLVLLAMF